MRTRIKLLSIVAIGAVSIITPVTAEAAVNYNLILVAGAGSLYGGTGMFSLDTAPEVTGVTNYTPAQVSNLAFNIDGQSFTLPSGLVEVQFLNGVFNSITYAGQIGSDANRFAFQSTASYVFYYNNLSSASYGTISASLASIPAVPEPATWAMMILGMGLVGGAMRRKQSSRTTVRFA